jgi:hypothetical protein
MEELDEKISRLEDTKIEFQCSFVDSYEKSCIFFNKIHTSPYSIFRIYNYVLIDLNVDK